MHNSFAGDRKGGTLWSEWHVKQRHKKPKAKCAYAGVGEKEERPRQLTYHVQLVQRQQGADIQETHREARPGRAQQQPHIYQQKEFQLDSFLPNSLLILLWGRHFSRFWGYQRSNKKNRLPFLQCKVRIHSRVEAEK